MNIVANMLGGKQRDLERLVEDMTKAIDNQWWGEVVSDASMIITLASSASTAATVYARIKRMSGEEVGHHEEH